MKKSSKTSNYSGKNETLCRLSSNYFILLAKTVTRGEITCVCKYTIDLILDNEFFCKIRFLHLSIMSVLSKLISITKNQYKINAIC